LELGEILIEMVIVSPILPTELLTVNWTIELIGVGVAVGSGVGAVVGVGTSVGFGVGVGIDSVSAMYGEPEVPSPELKIADERFR
jgi:hypothetical protein